MRIKCKPLSAAFKLVLSALATFGVLVQCGVLTGKPDFSVINYYTLLTNVMCAVYFFFAGIHVIRGGDTLSPKLKGAVCMGITVTGLVYHFLLAGTFTMHGTLAVSNVILHYIVPAMSVLDWLLFDKKGNYTATSPLIWLFLPDLYFVQVVVRVLLGFNAGGSGIRYPYPFIDAGVLGWGQVMLNVVVLNLLFTALGYIYYFADRLMAKHNKN